MTSKQKAPGCARAAEITASYEEQPKELGEEKRSSLPAEICGYTVALLGLLMLVLAIFTDQAQGGRVLIYFGLVMLLLAGMILTGVYKFSPKPQSSG